MSRKKTGQWLWSIAVALCFSSGVLAQPDTTSRVATEEQALQILLKSISHRTVKGSGQVPVYAQYLKDTLVTGGYRPEDIRIDPLGDTATLMATFPGKDRNRKPILILGHMDVVEARRDDWQRDPFVPVVENGYVFGRGAVDNKFDVSMIVATLAQLRRAGWQPGRDVILALSGDEETWLVTTRKLAQQLKHAEFALNGDAGGGALSESDTSALFYGLQGGEKTYADFTVSVTNPGGHSSRPVKKNAIYQLARSLEKISQYQFPVMSNELTQIYFKTNAPKATGAVGDAMRRYLANPGDQQAIATLSEDPDHIGQLRTTCVATQLAAGHAPNALPQRATANVNCRIFPGTTVESVRQTLLDTAADPEVTITAVQNGAIASPTSPLRDDIMAAVTKAVHAQYPDLPVIPSMSAGATDSMHFRALGVPSYGVSGLFIKASEDFSHGLNERVPVSAIKGALQYWSSILQDLAQ